MPVVLNAPDGIHLILISLADHQVVTGNSMGGVSMFQNFAMSTAVQGQNLRDVLNERSAADIAIIISKGSAFGFVEEWAGAAARWGASRGLASLQPDDTYVLIGKAGLGTGNGLEAVVKETDGGALLVTALLDDSIMSLGDRPRRNYVFSDGSTASSPVDGICDGPTGGFPAWATNYQDLSASLPQRTIRTSGGPIRFQFNGWTHTWRSNYARYGFILDKGTANEMALPPCAWSRASSDTNMHNTVSCDFIRTDIPPGLHTVEVAVQCREAGTADADDSVLYCVEPGECTFLVEEL